MKTVALFLALFLGVGLVARSFNGKIRLLLLIAIAALVVYSSLF